VRPGRLSIIGSGVVVDPFALLDEIRTMSALGVEVTSATLMLADNASLILDVHRRLDAARETRRGRNRIGTTGPGIGPAYEDKAGRRAIRIADLAEPDTLKRKLTALPNHHTIFLAAVGEEAVTVDEAYRALVDIAPRILPHAGQVWHRLGQLRRNDKRILFEGAQGVMLDVDHGTYPLVTSSNTVTGQAVTGAGVGPTSIGYVLGITKAYTTRVGGGPFPTEQSNDIGERLGDRGHEFGTVTGRRRRCSWFDAVMVRQAIKTAGINGIALTKPDVHDGFSEIRICTGYELDGQYLDHFPSGPAVPATVRPVYTPVDGWSDSTCGARSWADLSANAIKCTRLVEELIEAPVALLSTSPERNDTTLVTDPFQERKRHRGVGPAAFARTHPAANKPFV